jgi:neutral ceramidase
LGLVDSSPPTAPLVVLGGPANTYTHYIATEEEYGIQRYEGASTLYGQNTLNAYINLTTSYLPYLSANPPSAPLPAGPLPPDYASTALSFILPVPFDIAPLLQSYGQVLEDAPASASPGDTINATFVGANPRNDLRLESSYATVEQLVDGQWATVRDDGDWDLIFYWTQTSAVLQTSEVTLSWETNSTASSGRVAQPGTYRFRYFGASKAPVTETITQFEGTSGTFVIS